MAVKQRNGLSKASKMIQVILGCIAIISMFVTAGVALGQAQTAIEKAESVEIICRDIAVIQADIANIKEDIREIKNER